MTREEIDTAWSRALSAAVKEGEQFTRYHFAAIIRAQALEEARADLAEALIHDCENGSKFLNVKSAADFKRCYPHLSTAIESLKGQP